MRLLRHVMFAALTLGCGVQAGWAQENRLLFTSLSPAGSPNSLFFNSWAQRVNDQSGGTLKVEVRDGTTLANFGNTYDRVNADVIQIGWVQPAFVAGKFPLAEVTNLPFMTDDDINCSVSLSRYFKSPAMAAELKHIAVYPVRLPEIGTHLSAGVVYGRMCEYVDWFAGLFAGGPRFENGQLVVASDPGLGLSVNEAAAAKWRV